MSFRAAVERTGRSAATASADHQRDATVSRRQNATELRNAQLSVVSCKPLLRGMACSTLMPAPTTGENVPVSYRIERARRLVLTTACGALTDEDVLIHVRELTADPEFDASFRQLADFREVTSTELTSAGVRAVARKNPWKAGARRALVCDQDVLFGIARMFELLSADGGAEIQVFREMSDAQAWLGLDKME